MNLLQRLTGLSEEDPLWHIMKFLDDFIKVSNIDLRERTIPQPEIVDKLFEHLKHNDFYAFELYLNQNGEYTLSNLIRKLRIHEFYNLNDVRAAALWLTANLDYIQEEALKEIKSKARNITSPWAVSAELCL